MATPEQAIDVIHDAFGSHPGSRALHAKGAFFAGTFTATPVARRLTRAAHMQGTPVPVWVRWSDGSAHPHARDDKPDVSAPDTRGGPAPRFRARTREEFLGLWRAGAPGPGRAVRLPLFRAAPPPAVAPPLANPRAGALKPPRSFAEATFYPIHAYRWL